MKKLSKLLIAVGLLRSNGELGKVEEAEDGSRTDNARSLLQHGIANTVGACAFFLLCLQSVSL